MSRSIASFVFVLGLTVGVHDACSQSHTPDTSDDERTRVGRYQLVSHLDGRMLMLDTATGQCWSKRPGNRRWRNEGNPTRRGADSTAEARPVKPTLSLPSELVEMTFTQRETRAIPGSDGTVRIHLGDITEGQVRLTVLTSDDEELLGSTFVHADETVAFVLDEKQYTIHVNELRNLLVGDDFARLTIARASPSDADAPDE